MRLQGNAPNNERPRLGTLQLVGLSGVIPGRNQRSGTIQRALRASEPFAFVGDIVNDDVIPHLIGGGIEDATGIKPGKLVNESLSIKVSAEHEGVNLDAALRAALHFFQRLMNDSTMQQRRAPSAVQPPTAVQRRCRRLAVGYQNDLPVGGFV